MQERNQSVIIQACIEDVMKEFGPQNFDAAMKMAKTLRKYVHGTNFTGKIIFTVNCRNSGIGNIEAFVQKKISEI